VPALPVLASTFGRGISVAQMTVSLYMVGIACSQIIMGRCRTGSGGARAARSLMARPASPAVSPENLPQLIAARFLQALAAPPAWWSAAPSSAISTRANASAP